MIGPSVEAILGPKRFLAVYAASAIAGNGLAWAMGSSGFTMAVGASSSVSGLFGAYVAFRLINRGRLGLSGGDMGWLAQVVGLNVLIQLGSHSVDGWWVLDAREGWRGGRPRAAAVVQGLRSAAMQASTAGCFSAVCLTTLKLSCAPNSPQVAFGRGAGRGADSGHLGTAAWALVTPQRPGLTSDRSPLAACTICKLRWSKTSSATKQSAARHERVPQPDTLRRRRRPQRRPARPDAEPRRRCHVLERRRQLAGCAADAL
jgi:hypothetical protein